MKVMIIGAGVTGIAAAYRLKQLGLDAVIYEKEAEPYGLARSFIFDCKPLERYYHHFFRSDQNIMKLTEELGVSHGIQWHPAKMGYFSSGKLYPFGTPLSLLKFAPLSWTAKLQFGFNILQLLGIKDWESLQDVTARDWLTQHAGAKVYQTVWEPLLKGKFGADADEISMAWMWAKIHLRGNSKQLGYFKGSMQIFLDALAEGLNIECNRDVIYLSTDARGLLAETTLGHTCFDAVISTVPLPVFDKIAGHLLKAQERQRIGQIRYIAVSCLVMELETSFTPYYWTNVGDSSIPFGGIIEQTNMISVSEYNGRHIVYVSHYLREDSEYYHMEKEELLVAYLPYLKQINPAFSPEQIKNVYRFRDRYAQPVIPADYNRIRPDMTTSVQGLFVTSAAHIYPEDRGVNYAIRDGFRIAELVNQELN
jgi:protoporphyrinogen oxidase